MPFTSALESRTACVWISGRVNAGRYHRLGGGHFVDQWHTAIAMHRAWAIPLAAAGAVLHSALVVIPPSTRRAAGLPTNGADGAEAPHGAITPAGDARERRWRGTQLSIILPQRLRLSGLLCHGARPGAVNPAEPAICLAARGLWVAPPATLPARVRRARLAVRRRQHIRIDSALGRQHADLVARNPTTRPGVDDTQFDGIAIWVARL